jgi:hypothetical protein
MSGEFMGQRRTSRVRSYTVLAAALAAMAILPATALAQDASVGTYGGDGGNVLQQLESGNDSGAGGGTADSDSSGSLPFTGLDIGMALGGGLLLLASGVALSRLLVAQREP